MDGMGVRSKQLKVGLDLHGVLDAKPKLFGPLSSALVDAGHEVHIITGPEWSKKLENQLYDLEIYFTHFFSIVEYHKNRGTDMRIDEFGHVHLDPYLWDKTKGEYCARVGIDLHFDDSDTYGYFFKTPYARFFSKDTPRAKKMSL